MQFTALKFVVILVSTKRAFFALEYKAAFVLIVYGKEMLGLNGTLPDCLHKFGL